MKIKHFESDEDSGLKQMSKHSARSNLSVKSPPFVPESDYSEKIFVRVLPPTI